MIDYDKPDEDPIVAEVRRAREEIGTQFGNDLRAVLEYYQNRQAGSGRAYATPAGRNATAPSTPVKKAG